MTKTVSASFKKFYLTLLSWSNWALWCNDSVKCSVGIFNRSSSLDVYLCNNKKLIFGLLNENCTFKVLNHMISVNHSFGATCACVYIFTLMNGTKKYEERALKNRFSISSETFQWQSSKKLLSAATQKRDLGAHAVYGLRKMRIIRYSNHRYLGPTHQQNFCALKLTFCSSSQ